LSKLEFLGGTNGRSESVATPKVAISWIGSELIIHGALRRALQFLERSRQQVILLLSTIILILAILEKYYIMVGTQEKLDPEASAMLVSDPVQCQEGDAELSFHYWTSK
jgi:hypothetical protein